MAEKTKKKTLAIKRSRGGIKIKSGIKAGIVTNNKDPDKEGRKIITWP